MALKRAISVLHGVAACAALSTSLLAVAPIHAQTAQTEAMSFDIPAGSLQSALTAFADQSGLQLIYPPAAVAGRQVAALRANLPPRAALQRLIADSGLRIRQVDAKVIVLEGSGPRAGSNPSAELAPSVSSEPPATTEPVPVGSQRAAVSDVAQDGPEIVVTGSRIRGADSPSPMIVSTRKSLEDAGITDMATYSRVLPQNFTGGQNPGVAGVGDQGGQSNINNSTTLNLRGLGADATLTLINGHRLAYDALLQGIDISALPLAAVDRIEVIADGASALYGSDAVGGVVNILLRRDFSGVQTTARLGTSTDGGNTQQQYTAVTGARWASGGFMIAADYNHNTPIFTRDRDYTSRLNGAQMLMARQSQVSAVATGHQQLAEGVEFELDAQFADRRMEKATAFTPIAAPVVNGQITNPIVRSFAVTPSIRFELPMRWTATVQATHSVSETTIRSRAFQNSIETPGRALYNNRLNNIEASAEGPLFRLPGGTARLAVGGGYRSFRLGINVQQTTGGITRTTRDGSEERESLFAYGELSVPLVGPENRMPLLEKLQLSAAVRYERYEGIDEVATPKLGVIYSPHRDLTIKASWGRSFKIPTLNQVNQVQAGGLLPASLFAPQPAPPLAADATVLVLSGGNPNLRAERARTWTTTVEFRPKLVDGLTLKASYFDVDYRERISVPISDTLSVLSNPLFTDFVAFSPTLQEISDIIAGLPQDITNATGRPFDPAQIGAIIDARLRNSARERARGVDIAADYRIDVGPGERVIFNAAATYLDATRQLRPGLPVVERSGVIFSPPHWRARFGGSWEGANVQLSATLNYIGSVRDNRIAFDEDVEPFTTFDLSARARTTAADGPFRDVELRLSALNILNQKPFTIGTSDPAAIPFDSTNQSAIGRFISVSVTKSW